jgi:hypothetical protein
VIACGTATAVPFVVPLTVVVTQPAVMPASVQTTNDVVVAPPFAVTVAFSVTPVEDTGDAASVVTLGTPGTDVVNERISPFVVPTEFTPDAR